MEGEKKELQEKTESLESIVRMIELKAKNSADHGNIYILYVCFVIKIRYLKENKYDPEYASNFTETCKM